MRQSVVNQKRPIQTISRLRRFDRGPMNRQRKLNPEFQWNDASKILASRLGHRRPTCWCLDRGIWMSVKLVNGKLKKGVRRCGIWKKKRWHTIASGLYASAHGFTSNTHHTMPHHGTAHKEANKLRSNTSSNLAAPACFDSFARFVQCSQLTLTLNPTVGTVLRVFPEYKRNRRVVFPAASRPTRRTRRWFLVLYLDHFWPILLPLAWFFYFYYLPNVPLL